jgi:predicted acyltransferase
MTNTHQRFPALDVFRGLTICLMIVVNTSGDSSVTFAPITACQMERLYANRSCISLFLIRRRKCMSFVMNKWKDKTTAEVLGKIFKRTALIFLLGLPDVLVPFL